MALLALSSLQFVIQKAEQDENPNNLGFCGIINIGKSQVFWCFAANTYFSGFPAYRILAGANLF